MQEYADEQRVEQTRQDLLAKRDMAIERIQAQRLQVRPLTNTRQAVGSSTSRASSGRRSAGCGSCWTFVSYVLLPQVLRKLSKERNAYQLPGEARSRDIIDDYARLSSKV